MRKCTKLYDKTALIVNNLLVDSVQEMAEDSELKEFDEIFRQGQFEKKESVEDLMTKVSLLTHMFSREFQMYIHYNHGDELMKQLWNGVYYDEDVDYEELYLECN